MQTIWLEFRRPTGLIAALGSDTTFYIDGRWNAQTTRRKIEERVAELRTLREHYTELEFVGYTHSQAPFYNGKGGAIRSMKDPNPPLWAKCICDAPHESCACPTHPTCQGKHI